MPYYVYLLKCSDGSFYCGYTKDLQRRVTQHNIGIRGAKYTKYKRPVILTYWEEFNSLSDALRREYMIKKLTHNEKSQLISHGTFERSTQST